MKILIFLLRWLLWLPVLIIEEIFPDDLAEDANNMVALMATVGAATIVLGAIALVMVPYPMLHVFLVGFALYLFEGVIFHLWYRGAWGEGFL